jgi:hypothetical protein
MAKRGDRVAPPAKPGEWELVFGNSDAADGWEELVRQAPGPARDAFDSISKNPRDTAQLGRQHRLRGSLASVEVKGERCEQWQFEVTAGGRVWYAIDDERRRVVLVFASTKHPKATE